MNVRWRQVEDLFHEALSCSPEDREVFLAAACGADRELFDEVESLVTFEEGGRMLQSMVEQAAADLHAESALKAGSRVGPYVILREIGHGGMGVVYLAERADGHFEQKVALKVIGELPSAEGLQRFLTERQTLANLQHPNIARLLDGGTTDAGLPYFAMEYLEGEPITDYLARRQSSTIERIEIFEQVCAAIHYAHQQLIVHRDLKPSNILITADGTAKVLDFGIAKLIHAAGASPESVVSNEPRVLTPSYASPEQFRGSPVSTASDVYSLGAVLYELLAGHRPYNFQVIPPAHMERVICEQDPERPSLAVARHGGARTRKVAALPRELSGDLDGIVRKAMSKQPEDRYGSALELAEDLRRFRMGYPVVARRGGLLYRMGKHLRRRKLAFAAMSLLLVTWIAGTALVFHQAHVAARRATLVRDLANTLLVDFNEQSGTPRVSTARRAELVQTALASLGELSGAGAGGLRDTPRDASRDTSLDLQIAAAYRKVGDAQGDPLHRSLGDSAGAERSYRAALAILDRLRTLRQADRVVETERMRTLNQLGLLLRDSGSQDAALEALLTAASLADTLLHAAPRDASLRNMDAGIWENLSRVYSRQAKFREATAALEKAFGIVQQLLREDPRSRDFRETLADCTGGRMYSELLTGKLEEAYRDAQEILRLREELDRELPGDFEARRNLMLAYSRLGDILGYSKFPNLGNPKGASEYFRQTLKVAESLAAEDSTDRNASYNVQMARLRLGITLNESGSPDEAARYFQAGAVESERLLQSDAKSKRYLLAGAWFYQELAQQAERAGKTAEARSSYLRAESLTEQEAANDPGDMSVRVLDLLLVSAHGKMEAAVRGGGPGAGTNRANRATIAALEAEAMRTARMIESAGAAPFQARAYQAYAAFGEIHMMLGEAQAARRLYTRSLAGWHELQARKAVPKSLAQEPKRTEDLLSTAASDSANDPHELQLLAKR